MDKGFKTVTLLLALSVVTSRANIVPNAISCSTRMRECESSNLEQFDIPDSEVQQALGDRIFLAEFTVALQDYKKCSVMVRTEDVCKHYPMPESTKIFEFIESYLSAPCSIETIMAASSSPCLNVDSRKHEEIVIIVFICLLKMEMSSESEEPCQSLTQMWQCMRAGITDACGQAVGDLMQSVGDHMWSSAEGQSLIDHYKNRLDIDMRSCDWSNVLAKRYIQARNANEPVLSMLRRSIRM